MEFEKITEETLPKKGDLIRKQSREEVYKIVKYLGHGAYHITLAKKNNLAISGITLFVRTSDLIDHFEVAKGHARIF